MEVRLRLKIRLSHELSRTGSAGAGQGSPTVTTFFFARITKRSISLIEDPLDFR